MRQCWKRRAARAPTALSPARSRTKLARDIIRKSATGRLLYPICPIRKFADDETGIAVPQ